MSVTRCESLAGLVVLVRSYIAVTNQYTVVLFYVNIEHEIHVHEHVHVHVSRPNLSLDISP